MDWTERSNRKLEEEKQSYGDRRKRFKAWFE